ncbi:hypothetical protein GAYE_SCF48G5974 [Galdieria yellowstonensis]|uniref:Uncharacterized protein n=1 Tax=Galdieria yellowstonensis TaxID=3028027 RepID=A0AAV9IKL4_9RHOD|nr:hypothetical protein GAYE_SCF48G5974 [Galdieria yellowstonensis]
MCIDSSFRIAFALSTCPRVCCWSRKRFPVASSSIQAKFKGFFSDEPVKGPFPGRFRNWYLTKRDVAEVWCYRGSLGISSLSLGSCLVLGSFFPQSPHWLLDLSIWLSTLSLGVALQFIHIYAKVLKQALQILWLVGVLGALYVQLSSPSNELVLETLKNPSLLLFSGWTVVSLTGLLFKEAFCYRQYEAVALTLIVPFVALGHFFSVLSNEAATVMMSSFSLLYIYFSLRKFSSPIVDDIGDKSVFEYLEKTDR